MESTIDSTTGQACPVFLVAEVGQAHDGSLGMAHSFIDALSGSGVDAIKFQTHLADAESSGREPFRVNFSYEDSTRYDYWKRMQFTPAQWRGVKAHCDDKGLEFMSSPFSLAAVDLLEQIGTKRYKIGSGEVSNHLLLERVAQTGKPAILSSGMSSYEELDDAMQFLKQRSVSVSVLQCTTQYPTTAETVGLNVIRELRERYAVPVGLSDHSGTIYPSLAATALGAEILEFHVCFDRRCFGPDSTSSLTIDEVDRLIEGVRFIETAMANPVEKSDASSFAELKSIFGKSISLNKDLPRGHVLRFADLESKKPAGQGICASDFQSIVGRQLTRKMCRWDYLNLDDVA